MNTDLAILLVSAFVSGAGWGNWYTERAVRRDQAALNKGRMQLTMPVNPDDAATTMELLGEFIRKAEIQRLDQKEAP